MTSVLPPPRPVPAAGSQVPSDEALAPAAVQDREARIELYGRHVSGIYSCFSWRFGRDRAEDLVSETFLRALSSLSKFDARRSWRAWLFSIAGT